MNEIEILYISLNSENEFFIRLKETIYNGRDDFFMRRNIHTRIQHFDIGDIRTIDFKIYRRRNIYIILNIDEQFCKQFNKSQHLLHEIERLFNEIKLSQLLIVSYKECEAFHKFFPFSKNNFSQYESIKEGVYKSIDFLEYIISKNHRDRDILKDTSKAEFLLKEKEKRIQELEKKSTNSAMQNEKINEEKKLLEDEANKLKEKITLLEEEKQKETDNIKEIITFLAAMPKEISDEQEYLKTRRKRFTLFGGLFLSLGGLTALALIGNILSENKLCLPSITNTPQYFAYALAIGFPMAIAFLFYRQANVKSKEIEKINEKSILVQQVENALNSYNVLLSGDELKDKTISSIDRVINKIFDNNGKEEKSEKVEESKLSISDVQKLFKMGNDITKP